MAIFTVLAVGWVLTLVYSHEVEVQELYAELNAQDHEIVELCSQLRELDTEAALCGLEVRR